MAAPLEGCSDSTVRALHWTLSANEESKRTALLRPLVRCRDGASVVTMPKPRCDREPVEEKSGGKTTQHPKKKQRLQKSQLRLQSSKALQTPLHWLCAHDAMESTGDCVGGWPSRPSRPSSGASCLARQLLQQWPHALLMRDVVGLWPLSHFDDLNSHVPQSPQRELLLTLLQHLVHLECGHPEVLMMLDSKELHSLVRMLHRLEASSEDSAPVTEALRRGLTLAAQRAPRHMACLEAAEQRRDAQRWQSRGKETRHRVEALRRLSGAAPRSVPRRGAESLPRALEAWNARRDGYEERLQQLRFELGRIPAAKTPNGAQRSAVVTEAETKASPEDAEMPSAGPGDGGASEAEVLIRSLRRQRLGGAGTGAALREALGKAVERLAVDLYEMESHFVYELVQNADDNGYADCEPWLRLELHRDDDGGSFFVSVNNELGLSAKDVRALCDVNASSKKGRQGVTGHKGIGWKSCFQVSDCPYMLSGSFTFKFDVKALGKLGYVTPSWVGEEELHSLPPVVWEAYYAGYTVTYLPLRPGTEDSVEVALAHLEEHLPCLLFLRRLRCVELATSSRRARLAVEDHCENDHVSVVCSTGDGPSQAVRHEFLMHRHSVVLDERELVLNLAFPQDGVGPPSEKLPCQALYCLLPVRKLGFCFCLDGPFELIASRGDIHEGSRQNQVLIDALPNAFAAALESHPSLAPRALALLGPKPPEALWQAVHGSLLHQLQGTACVPLEDGGLEEPERCLQRPTGATACDASRLVLSDLLWRACGRRWAKPGAATLEEMSFQHWQQVLRYRDADWPQGLCGSWLAKDAEDDTDASASPFRCLFAYLAEYLRHAEVPAEVLQQLWDLELLPAERPKEAVAERAAALPLLYRPSAVVLCHGRDDADGRLVVEPLWAWDKLLESGTLRVLDQTLEQQMGSESSELLQALCVPLAPEPLLQQLIDRFLLDDIRDHEVLWAMLAVLQQLFLQGTVPPQKTWRDLGQVLWLPCLTGGALRAHCAVCPSFLGCAAVDREAVRGAAAAAAGRKAKEIAACCAAGLPLGLSFVDTAYLSDATGDGIAWEAFFEALGVRMLRLAQRDAVVQPAPTETAATSKLPQVASSSKTSQIWAQRKLEQLSQSQLSQMLQPVHHKWRLGDEVLVPEAALATDASALELARHLASRDWWQRKASGAAPSFEYLLRRLPHGATWLRELPVPVKGRRARLADHLVEHSELAQLCGPWLPMVQLPEHRTQEVRHVLMSSLGLLGDASIASSLLRCLKAVAENCQDVSLYVALYQRLAKMEVEPQTRQQLKELIFVPGHGMLTSGGCAWSDSELLQLAEVPALCAHYERHGPSMEHYFNGILQLDFRFTVSHLLGALRRMVSRVNDGESAVPGRSGLEGMMDTTAEIYSLLSLYLKDHPKEVGPLRRSFSSERLLLLRQPGAPKRLQAEEAWWQLAPDLHQVKSLRSLALQQRFSEDLKPFFLAVGVTEEMTRERLRALLQRPQEVPTLSQWRGLNVSDVEDLGMLQTSSNFRPPDWRAPDSDGEAAPGETDPATAGPTGRGRHEPDFQPPRREGTPHVPAMRTREEVERIQREERQRAEQRAAEQRNGGAGGAGGFRFAPNRPVDDDHGRAAGRAGSEAAPPRSAGAKDEGPRADQRDFSGRQEDNEAADEGVQQLQELQNRLEELTLESQRRQQESYELRSRWAQAEDDAERYMKILQEFYAAEASLRQDELG